MELIILNGSPAAGKSTLAEKLHNDLPLSLLADVDEWRRLVSHWRENREESLRLSYLFTLGAVEAYLKAGQSVIVDKAILSSDETIDGLVELGTKYGAHVHEFILMADKETIVARAQQRGFHKNGLLTPTKVLELFERAQNLCKNRPNAIVIDTGILTPEEVHARVMQAIS
jgi:chloramphenicol 3-O-phosphotransferase